MAEFNIRLYVNFEFKGRYYEDSTIISPRVMNIELIQCDNIGDGPTDDAVNGLKMGMSELYNQCSWMDGWELTVYKAPNWHPDCTDHDSFVNSCESFLDSVYENETIAYHFFHKCGTSWRNYDYQVGPAWYNRTISSIDDQNWWGFQTRPFQVRTFHEVLHMFVDRDVPGVTNHMAGSDEHTLGTHKYSSYWNKDVTTVMSDIYSDKAEEGPCSKSASPLLGETDFLFSQCTLDALKLSSDWCANNCSGW